MALPLPHPQRRAQRIQLGSALPAVLLKQDGRRTKGKLSSISVNGGVLQLRHALAQGDFVEVRFQMESGMVQGLAEMLSPTRASSLASDGVRQPFRFVAMGDEEHRALRAAAADWTQPGLTVQPFPPL